MLDPAFWSSICAFSIPILVLPPMMESSVASALVISFSFSSPSHAILFFCHSFETANQRHVFDPVCGANTKSNKDSMTLRVIALASCILEDVNY
ncbi:hypothetical protein SLEP1_g43106 [Rubroshorea leprosula]|uniref:Secreted protein n=1 Tax=Rubroshorea leprosula TaxID=152421 RepID=A0AAV5LBY9_9ROSI|nr:hypothetical protein SLEP1_g43106 [Rubroshorea leprosula]